MIHPRIINASPEPNNASMHYWQALEDPRLIIKRLRDEHGYTSDRQLALAAGVKQPTLSRYLAAKSKPMEVATFQALALLFGVSLSELLGETPVASKPAREAKVLLDHMNPATRAQWLRIGAALIDAPAPTPEEDPG